jgi:hypothetical protein
MRNAMHRASLPRPARLRRVALASAHLGLLLYASLGAPLSAPAAAQAAREPKLPIAWNRFYDYDGIVGLCRKLADSRPDLCTLSFIGPSWEGRPMPLLTIMNPATGAELSKSAMWVDANVHGNEVQGSEAAVYMAWTLLERYGELPAITELVDERVFYILPMVNPDGRQHWFDAPNTSSSSRSGTRPLDNDRDGALDEDGPDDLDGDGEILRMRKRVAPGTGDFVLDRKDPRVMERVAPADRLRLGADWVQLGEEGLDNDGDGRVNEDGLGGYDLNRNWPSGWQPEYVQYGAGDYPFSHPEAAAIGKFLYEHPNVAAVQSFHNAGGMILRGPGAKEREDYYPASDRRTYDAIADDGERILPFYRNMVIWSDLYTVHGGFVNFTGEGLGIISFTNELWNSAQYYSEGAEGGAGFDEDVGRTGRALFFDDHVLFGDTWVDWHAVEHPQYGTVELGGFRKMTSRVPPPFMIEEMLHRNAAFCLFHAAQLPKLAAGELTVDEGPGGSSVITLELRNEAWIPTRTAVAADKGLGRPDIVTLEGEELVVVAGGTGADRFDLTDFRAVEHEPARLVLERGIGGHDTVRLRWIVRGKGAFRVRLLTEKAGELVVVGAL